MAHQSRLRQGRVSVPGQTYHIITSSCSRQPIFDDPQTARTIILEMRRMHEEGWLHSHAWALMPDHLHWLFTLRERASLSATINRFKSASAHSVRQLHREYRTIWQKGFFDHAARSDEDLRTIARYIIANPLRAELCKAIGDYPWWDAEWL